MTDPILAAERAAPRAADAHAWERIVVPFAGGDLSCLVGGRGAPVLLLHSINAAASNTEMAPLAERLAGRRRVYNLDLPGFGASARTDVLYDVDRYVCAIEATAAAIAAREGAGPIDAVALSLTSEFLARSAMTAPARWRSLTLISPTGFQAAVDNAADAPVGTFEQRWLSRLLSTRAGPVLFRMLASPPSIRYFLRRTFGRKDVDARTLAAALDAVKAPGAEHAPLAFLSGRLFSRDIQRVYRSLGMPILLIHGVRGDFTDYTKADWTRDGPNWRSAVFDTGALPQVELPDLVSEEISRHLSDVLGEPHAASEPAPIEA
jgi:pimeloyl-ACP methyl ester carboxylesterase